MKRVGALLSIAFLVTLVSLAMTLPASGDAKPPKDSATLEFTIVVDSEPGAEPSAQRAVDEIRKLANIGSSGQDGFRVDSFFDITYEVSFDDDTGRSKTTITVVMHAEPNDPDALNPGAVIDQVRKAAGDKGEYKGHVTLLR